MCAYTGNNTCGEGSVGRCLAREPQMGLATNPAYALSQNGAQPSPIHGRRSTSGTAQYNMNINPSYLLGTSANVGYTNSNTANEYDYPVANSPPM